MKSRVLLLAVVAAVAGAAYAQQYRWVDEKGRVQYTDTPPPASAKNVQKKNFKGNSVGQQPSYALDRAARVAPVTLYTHPICKEACQVARDVLTKRGVPFTEVVATEADKVEQLKKVSGSDAVPVLVVGDYVERTISAETYNRALDRAGYPSAVLPASR
jgi:glutaredoxin